MIKFTVRFFLILLVLCSAHAFQISEVSNFKNLSSGTVFFFTENCSSCRRQVKELFCLDKPIIGVTNIDRYKKVWSYSKKLKLVKRGVNNVYFKDTSILKSMGLNPNHYPQTAIIKKGKLFTAFKGVVSCASMKKKITKLMKDSQ